MSFENLKNKGIEGVKVNVQFVGYIFDLSSIMSNEQLKNITQDEFEEKIREYVNKLGKPKANINLEG